MNSKQKTHGVFYQKGNVEQWHIMSLKDFMDINNKNYQLVIVFVGDFVECLVEQAVLVSINSK